MSIVRVGSTQKFSENWEKIFGGGKRKASKTASAKGKKPAKKKSAKAKARKKK